jgi:O-succinylbenzoate synthase
VNAFVLLLTYLLESNALMKQETAKQIIYENIELIKPEKRDELMADLENRTGQKINRISIGRIDFLRDTALIKIYFYEE